MHSKSEKKMNTLDKEILKTLLGKEDISIYELNKTLKKNYVTVLRHVQKMLKDEVLKANQSKTFRETKLLQVTPKGIATFLLKGNLTRKELLEIKPDEIFLKPAESLQERILNEESLRETLADTLLEIRPKVNLEFFDEKWFKEVFYETTWKAIAKSMKKHEKEYIEKGIWPPKKAHAKD
jgi:predicted ArsR family transcriptional regulator